MGITVSTSPQNITASVGETQIDVTVSGGIGPSGTGAGSVTWNDVTGKPATFTPSSHTHDYVEVAGGSTYTNFLTTAGNLGGALSEIDSALGDRALASHTHDSLTGANSSLMCDDNIIAIVADGIYLNGTQIVPYQIGTTSGLIVKTGTTGVLETLAQGTAGQVLVVNSGATAMEWKTLAAADVGAAALSHAHGASDITSGTIDTARLGSGTANNTTYLRGDQTWATVTSGSTSASDLTSGTLADARLSAKAQAAIDLYLWSAFR